MRSIIQNLYYYCYYYFYHAAAAAAAASNSAAPLSSAAPPLLPLSLLSSPLPPSFFLQLTDSRTSTTTTSSSSSSHSSSAKSDEVTHLGSSTAVVITCAGVAAAAAAAAGETDRKGGEHHSSLHEILTRSFSAASSRVLPCSCCSSLVPITSSSSSSSCSSLPPPLAAFPSTSFRRLSSGARTSVPLGHRPSASAVISSSPSFSSCFPFTISSSAPLSVARRHLTRGRTRVGSSSSSRASRTTPKGRGKNNNRNSNSSRKTSKTRAAGKSKRKGSTKAGTRRGVAAKTAASAPPSSSPADGKKGREGGPQAPSLAQLARVQEALEGGTGAPLSAEEARVYADFFGIDLEKAAAATAAAAASHSGVAAAGTRKLSAAAALQLYHAQLRRQAAQDLGRQAALEQRQRVERQEDLPLFLLSYDPAARAFAFFSVAADSVAATVRLPDRTVGGASSSGGAAAPSPHHNNNNSNNGNKKNNSPNNSVRSGASTDDFSWEQASALLAVTKGQTRLLAVPVVATEGERAALAATGALGELERMLGGCGVLLAYEADTLTLAAALHHNSDGERGLGLRPLLQLAAPPPAAGAAATGKGAEKEKARAGGKKDSPRVGTPARDGDAAVVVAVAAPSALGPRELLLRFRTVWARLRTLACRTADATAEDPGEVVRDLLLPRHDVFVVHLVRAGTRGMNVALWGPRRRRRYAAKGMLADVLHQLLSLGSDRFILLPTYRSDRALLLRCQTALRRAGKRCLITFAPTVDERFRTAFQSDPARYWDSLRAAVSGSGGAAGSAPVTDEELVHRVQLATARTLREVQLRRQSFDVTAGHHSHGGGGGGGKRNSGEDASDEDGAVAPTTAAEAAEAASEVDKWLAVLHSPKRRAAERAALESFGRALAVAYVSTEHTAFARPRNPHAAVNYVVCAAFADQAEGEEEGGGGGSGSVSGGRGKGRHGVGQTPAPLLRVVAPAVRFERRGQFRLPSLAPYDVLVAHDAKHLLLLAGDDPELHRFLRRGGRVWCTQLAEYLLDAQRTASGRNGLRAVALRHGTVLPALTPGGQMRGGDGGPVVGAAPEALPLAVLSRYVCSAARAVRAVAARQRERGCAQSQLLSLQHRMDALLAMTAIERNGLFVDAAEGARQQAAVVNATRVLDRALDAYVPREVAADMRQFFDWGSATHLHAFFFGGYVRLGSGRWSRQRGSSGWLSNLVHLCHRFGSFAAMTNELHLQRFATEHRLPPKGRLPQRISDYLTRPGSAAAAAAASPTAGASADTTSSGRRRGSSSSAAAVTHHQQQQQPSFSPFPPSSSAGRKRYRLVLFDIETTGLNVTTDAIIELAFYDPVEQTSFSSLVHPGTRHVTPRTVAIHGITDEQLAGAPSAAAVMEGLFQYLRLDRRSRDPNEVLVLVGHNVFALDEPMLRAAMDTHAPLADHDAVLFCDSLTILKDRKAALAAQLGDRGRVSATVAAGGPGAGGGGSRASGGKDGRRRRGGRGADGSNQSGASAASAALNDERVLAALTASLRMGKLVENLRVPLQRGQQLHRAATDAAALWLVLVRALGLSGLHSAERQRDAVLARAADTLLQHPAIGCFLPEERRHVDVTVSLPGVAQAVISDGRALKGLQSHPLTDETLETLRARGVEPAGLLLRRRHLDYSTARFLQCDPGTAALDLGAPSSPADGETDGSPCDRRDPPAELAAAASGGGGGGTVHPDGCVRQFIDMTSTSTGRTTSLFPSCQNIPKDDKSLVRRMLVSRFGAEGRCVEVDYAQLEIVVLAVLCRDAALTRDLRNGLDFHIKRAELFSGIPYKTILEGCRRDVPRYVRLRKTAKQFTFQRLYGAGVALLHRTTGIPVADLKKSIEAEAREYPGIARFYQHVRAVALRANNPGLPTHFIAELPTGARVSFHTRDAVLNLPPIKNYPVQSYGAELAQMMLGRLARHFAGCDNYGQRAFLVNFVHDSVWIDCHLSVLERCVRDARRILSEADAYVPRAFPGVTVEVPLQVSATCGADMSAMQSIPKDGDVSFAAAQTRNPTSADAAVRALVGSLPIVAAVGGGGGAAQQQPPPPPPPRDGIMGGDDDQEEEGEEETEEEHYDDDKSYHHDQLKSRRTDSRDEEEEEDEETDNGGETAIDRRHRRRAGASFDNDESEHAEEEKDEESESDSDSSDSSDSDREEEEGEEENEEEEEEAYSDDDSEEVESGEADEESFESTITEETEESEDSDDATGDDSLFLGNGAGAVHIVV